MGNQLKTPPSYAIASVDHALRLATILQLEGALTISEASQRLGVARSTAHRLLAMLRYRDFAVQGDDKVYRAGPVLELAAHSPSTAAQLRAAALPHLHRLVDVLGESVNLTVRTGATARFIASVESGQALRVTSREGMVFPAHRTTAGLLLLAELDEQALAAVYGADDSADTPNMASLLKDLAKIRSNGFALNHGRSERGVVAVGVPVRGPAGDSLAGLSVSIPSIRYSSRSLTHLVAHLNATARLLEADLAAQP